MAFSEGANLKFNDDICVVGGGDEPLLLVSYVDDILVQILWRGSKSLTDI